MSTQKYNYAIVSPGTEEYAEYGALRHEVFCAELGRVPSDAHESAERPIESDEFDADSIHVLCRETETGHAVGCARLILPNSRGINVLSRYQLHSDLSLGSDRVGEIGRLAISSKLRRRRRGVEFTNRAGRPGFLEDAIRDISRDGPTVALGLYRELFRLASEHGITHCFAAMETSLSRMLNRLGFPFDPAGPINHTVQPARQPYIIGAHALRDALASRNSCLYKLLFAGEGQHAAVNANTWSLPAKNPSFALA